LTAIAVVAPVAGSIQNRAPLTVDTETSFRPTATMPLRLIAPAAAWKSPVSGRVLAAPGPGSAPSSPSGTTSSHRRDESVT